MARMVLGHLNVGNNASNLLRFSLDEHAFFNAGAQVGGKLRCKGIARVSDEALMHVTPASFQVRIHSGKRTFHGGSVGWNGILVTTAMAKRGQLLRDRIRRPLYRFSPAINTTRSMMNNSTIVVSRIS